jgi:nitrogen fixation protein FixH
MNLLLSIFGGMLLTAVIYALGRRARLSNFWASVLAAGAPSLAYMIYAVLHWPGLDVLTIHLVAYPTVAVLLSQLYGAKADHAKSLHWAPKLMIVFFVILSLVYGMLVYVAGNGLPPALAAWLMPNTQGKAIHTGFAGVVEHHAEAAKVIGHHQKMTARLAELGWTVSASGFASASTTQATSIGVHIRDSAGHGVEHVEVAVAWARPGQAPTPALRLTPTEPGHYQGELPRLEAGSWVATLHLVRASDSIRLEHSLDVR